MLLTKKNIKNIIDNIDKKGRKYFLYDKKHFFIFLYHSFIYNNKLDGNIKCISYGNHGFIIQPAVELNIYDNIIISEKYKYKNYISKILYNKHESIKFIYNEYLIGKQLQKIDPNNHFFIYAIDMDKDSNRFSNIIMKKGYSLKDYLHKITENDVYKIFINLLNGLEILLKNDINNFDIKYDNILLSRVDTNKYKCVFIDFTAELILKDKKDFTDFCSSFKNYIHPYWPFEINYILNQNEKNKKKFSLYEKNRTIDTDYYMKNIYSILMEDLNNNIKNFYEKIIIFEFGKMFEHLINYYLKNYNTNTYKNFKNNIKFLIDDDYTKRFSIEKIKKNFNFSINDYTLYLK